MLWLVMPLTICQLIPVPAPRSTVYSESELIVARDHFKQQMGLAFANDLKLLTPDQQGMLKSTSIDVPLSGPHPFAFWTEFRDSGTRIVLPAESLLFRRDILISFCTLSTKGYRAVFDYVALLRLRRKDRLNFAMPEPLDAFGISDNALELPMINRCTEDSFTDSITFILLHEVGHIVRQRYQKNLPSQQKEADSDLFAIQQMLANGEMPLTLPGIPLKVSNSRPS